MIVVLSPLVVLGVYVMGFFMGLRYAQKDIQEQRIEMDLDYETGEKKDV